MDPYQGPAFGTTDTYTPDNLIAGDFPTITDEVTIAEGQNIVRGTVLGKIEYSGEYVKSLAAASDGSEVPVAIALKDADASEGAVASTVYLTGEFNERALTIGEGHTAASVKAALRAVSIFIKGSVAAG